MSQWGKNDEASNSVLWAVQGFKKAPTSTNQTNFFGNTTSDAFVTNMKVGQFGADANEVAANPAIAHQGWTVRKEGSGGRAGRVQWETLVAGGIPNDASDDTVLPDYALTFTISPSNASGNSTNNDWVTFSSNAASTPSGATISYYWQYWNGSAFANLSNGGAYANAATKVLSVKANTSPTLNGTKYRVAAAATGATTIYSSNATITITS